MQINQGNLLEALELIRLKREEQEFERREDTTNVQLESYLGRNQSIETGNISSELCQLTTCNRAEQNLTPNSSGTSTGAVISTDETSSKTVEICRGHEIANQLQLDHRINQEPLLDTGENKGLRGTTSSIDECRPHQNSLTLSESMQREIIVNTEFNESTDTNQRLARTKNQHFQEAETSNRSEESQPFPNENSEEPPKPPKLKQGVCKVANQIECVKTDNENNVNVNVTYESNEDSPVCPRELQDSANTSLSKFDKEFINTTVLITTIKVPKKFRQDNTMPTDLGDKRISDDKTKMKTKKKLKKVFQDCNEQRIENALDRFIGVQNILNLLQENELNSKQMQIERCIQTDYQENSRTTPDAGRQNSVKLATNAKEEEQKKRELSFDTNAKDAVDAKSTEDSNRMKERLD